MPDDLTAGDILMEQGAEEARRRPKAELGKLAELLERSGIDIEDIGKINRVNLWQGFYKDEEGEAHTVDMAGIQLVPTWESGPEWPVVQPAKPTIVRPRARRAEKTTGFKKAVILPDVQIGFRMMRDGSLDPFHDDRAIDVALAIIREVQPDRVICLGDGIDFPAQSKYIQEPSWAMTTQHAIDRKHRYHADIRAEAPGAEQDELEGNHDLRLARSIMVNAAHSFGLQRANLPESWPVLTVPNLCRYDELGVTYHPGYPANAIWLSDNLRCIHGLKVKSAGSTAAVVADDERVSTIFGHIHRIELQHRTRQTRVGPKFTLAASPGCLCRVDGAVPSVKGGIDLLGRPLTSYENWQQGVAVATYEEGDGPFSLEMVPIHEGVAIYRGERFAA